MRTSAVGEPRWRGYLSELVAGEVSSLTRYYDRVIEWLPRPLSRGELLSRIEAPAKLSIADPESFPDISDEEDRRTAVLVNGTFNHSLDVQQLLDTLRPRLARSSRLLLVLYNPYFRGLYALANRLGLRREDVPDTLLTRVDLQNIAELTGFEVVRQRNVAYMPFRLFGLGTLLNRVLPIVPGLRWLGLTYLAILRPRRAESSRCGLSCIVPVRNERGNIQALLERFPDLDCEREIIFVEGHSSDGTWEEIQRALPRFAGRLRLRALQQRGRGKADAVRLGVASATLPLVMIFDADLTVPPELVGRFYNAYLRGHGDLINGSRLVYPIEGGAMRFANRLGNVFFAKALSWLLGLRVGDALCGTKLFRRSDYLRMTGWREDFGTLDPFGDFELLFSSAELGLKVIDVPIRYLARTYGETNIRRFRDGLRLLQMTLGGFAQVKLGKRPRR